MIYFQLLGTWYEYKSDQRVYETDGKCATVEFTKSKTEEGVLLMKVTERVKKVTCNIII